MEQKEEISCTLNFWFLAVMQAGIFVGGLWGIYVFKELNLTREKVWYWVGGVVLIGGAVMLALSK